MSNFIFLISLFLLALTAKAQDRTSLYHFCDNTTTFTPNTTFQSNRNSLFSALSSNASTSNGFYNASSGQNPNRVNGLFLCRADVSAANCANCVKFATSDVVSKCPIEKEAVIWYDECLFRYSNKSIFSIMATAPSVVMWNTQNATNTTQFNDLVGTTLNKAAADAARTTRRFSVEKANVSTFQSLYSLVQCTPDLSGLDCNQCLVQTFSILRRGYIGGRVLAPSCSFRFEVYPFYNESALVVATPPPPPPVVAPPPDAIINPPKGRGRKSWVIIIAIVVPVGVSIFLFIVGYCLLTRRGKKYNIVQEDNGGADITTIESLQYDLNTIEVATDRFAESNKLGEGGFGAVYKGTLPNGQEIAVKRLSMSSCQGIQEFKTEALLVAKLQHRNLVRLLGFCVEGEEKILVYEYVPNQSLDYFLFDPSRQGLLDWSRRYKIIRGIARGILYLHEDSRLRIIHRDLKASNVLLDSDMNAKISDFGMARIFGVDQTQGSTNRIVGTYGYMSPEYAMHGQFSVKSDIYSFGVLVLEILTGKKNSSFYQTEGAGDLMSYAWKLWQDGRPLDFLDPILGDSYARSEVIRCIQIGLLCVQEDPTERPTMATIVLMLNSYSVTLPSPNEPAFFLHSRTERVKVLDSDQSTSHSQSMQDSIYEVSITELHPR